MKKKTDFKKLALMGITGGVMLASSASAGQESKIDNSNHLLAAGCNSGKHGCSTAYQPRGSGCASSSQPQNNYYNANQGQMPGQPASSGCNSAPQPQAYRNNPQWETADMGKVNNGQPTLAGESQLLSQLNEEGKAVYRGLDPEGKALAIKLAETSSDKNQAVKLAAQKMAEKRASTNMPRY